MPSKESDLINTLLKRLSYVEYLEEKSQRRCEIADELEGSRSTIYRGLNELENHGVVAEEGGEFRVTDFGDRTYKLASKFVRNANRVNRAKGFLMGEGTQDVPDSVLMGGDIVEPVDGTPDRLTIPLRDIFERANQLSGFLARPHTIEIERLTNRDSGRKTQGQLFLSEEAHKWIRNNDFQPHSDKGRKVKHHRHVLKLLIVSTYDKLRGCLHRLVSPRLQYIRNNSCGQ